MEINLSKVATCNQTLSLRKLSADFDGLAVEVDFQLYLVASASASMSFTTGLNLTVSYPSHLIQRTRLADTFI